MADDELRMRATWEDRISDQMRGIINNLRHFARWGRGRLWLEPNVINRLRAMRGPGESFSNVILRIAESEGANAPEVGQ